MNNQIQNEMNIAAELIDMFNENGVDLQKLLKLSVTQKRKLCDNIKKTLKKKKGKKRKPKGKSAYIFFCTEARKIHAEEFKELDNQRQVMKRLGELWREAKKEGNVEKYEKMAKKDKQKVSEENSESENEDSEKEEERVAAKKPKRASSSYIFFCREWRDELEEMSPREKTKVLGSLWKSFKKAYTKKTDWEPESDGIANKDKLEEWIEDMKSKMEGLLELTKKDKKRYDNELQAWESENGNAVSDSESE